MKSVSRLSLGIPLLLLLLLSRGADAANSIPEKWDDEEKSHRSLAQDIGHDFADVFTTSDNLLTLSALGGAAFAAHALDDDIATSRFNSEMSDDASLDGAFEVAVSLKG